jgi:hypothetical protein
MNAIIGHTGFIGNILKKNILGEYYNRSNIESMINKSYNIIYCAGVPSVKWVANKYPTEDMENIERLLKSLYYVKCNKFVLISTISIYDNESYGINRKNFEDNLIKKFGDKLLIVRLPAVYWEGLKKNLLFDMLNNTLVKEINACDEYQWYNVNNIKLDIENALSKKEQIVELYPEPISNAVLMSLFDKKFNFFDDCDFAYIQNIKPKNGYFKKSDEVIKELKEFINGYS